MNDATGTFAALDRSIEDTVERAKLEARIHSRARTLMRENGLAHDYDENEALEQATLEVTGSFHTDE